MSRNQVFGTLRKNYYLW